LCCPAANQTMTNCSNCVIGAGSAFGRPGYDNTCGKRFDGEYDCKYTFHRAGFNLKPLDLQGKVGLLQLDKQDA